MQPLSSLFITDFAVDEILDSRQIPIDEIDHALERFLRWRLINGLLQHHLDLLWNTISFFSSQNLGDFTFWDKTRQSLS